MAMHLFHSFETFQPSLDEVFDRWEQNFSHRHEPKSQVIRPLDLELTLSPEQATRGGSVPLDVPIARRCEACDATGVAGYYTCDQCEGHGLTWSTSRVDVLLSPPVRDGSVIKIPLKHLGVTNFVLRVNVHVV